MKEEYFSKYSIIKNADKMLEKLHKKINTKAIKYIKEKSFVELKAMHSQFNVIDNKTLLEAQKNPDDYLDLVVRVSGYSAYFNDLGKPVQDDIIRRTLFNSY